MKFRGKRRCDMGGVGWLGVQGGFHQNTFLYMYETFKQ